MCGVNKMYNNREENLFGKKTTAVMEEERSAVTERSYSGAQTTQKTTTFTPVTKNPGRLTVTNTGEQATQTAVTAKPKEKIQTKNIAMMVVYSVVAIALAAIIAVNAITLGGISATNAQLSAELTTLETTYSALSTELSAVSSTERMTELASSQFDLTSSSAAATASFSVPSYVTVETQTFENNWFDNFLDNLM